MSLLSTVWSSSLPGCGYDIVSMLKSPSALFAASNGYVYQIDSMTGAVLQTNGLSGRGRNEVRLALSADGSVLLVGTNGYALGLDPSSLNTLWQTSLPDCGYNVVSVVAGSSSAFFGSAGYVYRLDPSNGNILNTNSLKGCGNDEVRLAVSFDNNTLYVGTNGYALGLSTSDVSTQWQTSLPSCGYNIVSVASGGGNVLYAASNGYVYRVQQSDGTVLQKNELSGRGYNEVRLSLDANGTILAAGTNGYLLGLSPSDISTQWQTSLPDCGYNIVNPLCGDGVVYAGSNGYVYELNASNGSVNATNSLSGRGNNEVRLAADNDNEFLWSGTNGYALGLALEDYPAVEGPWMVNMDGNTLLRKLAIPGTHDSGTYAMTPFSPVGLDMPAWLPYVQAAAGAAGIAVGGVMAMWGIAQGQNFGQQLSDGIRYLDLRLQNVGGNMNFVHGLVSAPLSDLINQLSTFYADSANSKEIVFLDFQHTFGMDDSSVSSLMTQLQTAFSNQFIMPTVGTDVTLNALWQGSGRIIVLYDDDSVVSQYDFLWNRSNINSPWPNVQSISALQTALNDELPYGGSSFFVLQGILTPNGTTIAEGFIPFSGNPASLLDQALQVDPVLNGWINNDWASDGLNIVICDWYDRTNFVDIVVNLNKSGGLGNAQRERFASLSSQIVAYHQEQLKQLGFTDAPVVTTV